MGRDCEEYKKCMLLPLLSCYVLSSFFQFMMSVSVKETSSLQICNFYVFSSIARNAIERIQNDRKLLLMFVKFCLEYVG